MKKLTNPNLVKLMASILLFTPLITAQAADYTWGGGDSVYTDTSAAGWAGGPPNLAAGDAATINSGAIEYVAGGDFIVGSSQSFTMNGGSFTQTGSIAWMNIGNAAGGGTVTINSGATFNTGTAARMLVGNFGKVANLNVNGGTYNAMGTLTRVGDGSLVTSTLSLSGSADANLGALEIYKGQVLANGGTLDYTGIDFKSGSFTIDGATVTQSAGNMSVNANSDFSLASGHFSVANGLFVADGGSSSISGGTFTAGQLSFTSDDVIDFAGGVIHLDGSSSEGILTTGGTQYLNFTSGSVGSLFVDNLDASGLNALLSDGRIRVDGVTNEAFFSASVDGSGYSISAIPEPSALVLVLLGLIPVVTFLRRRQS
ncbi:PEP-CTERM sorting domain-containing protein [Kiritimatiellota bacterium B12222]|nr:PEP-CTERM sorting domain-containing protein [Kiritimatiellota bacterium B12222]